jgi:uncharacterized protein (UPF0335 family)
MKAMDKATVTISVEEYLKMKNEIEKVHRLESELFLINCKARDLFLDIMQLNDKYDISNKVKKYIDMRKEDEGK